MGRIERTLREVSTQIMTDEENSLWQRIQGFFALRVAPTERLAGDPGNIFVDDVSNRRQRLVAAIVALLLHAVLVFLYIPAFTRQLPLENQVIELTQLARPSGGSPPVVEEKPPEVPPVVEPKPKLIPIPDPTPREPEPIMREITVDAPTDVTSEFNIALNVGPIGPPSTRPGRGTGSGDSPGPGAGIETPGVGGTSYPVLLQETMPNYTDEAIRAKVSGTLLLQVVVRKDGSVDSFKILRPLGYGLEETAIKEIAQNWVFRPGMKNGRPVDVYAIVEVAFTLR